MPRNRHLVDQAVLTPVLATLRARDAEPLGRARPEGLQPNLTVVDKGNSGPATLRLYDAIGGWFGITAADVAEALDGIADTRDLKVRINSPGGDVFDGTAIYNLLATRAGQVDVIVDGLAASAASFIAQAGDTITMNRGTQMMIHDAHGFTIGNAGDHRATAELLDGVSDEIAGIYAARAGMTKADWRARMVEESWYNAEAAVEAGLADSTAAADDGDQEDDEEAAQKAAASWSLRPAASAHHLAVAASTTTPVPPPAEVDGDAFDEVLDHETFTNLGEWLDDVFSPTSGYDPDTLASTIADVYGNADAPPTVPAAPAQPRTTIPIEEFLDDLVKGIQEGVAP